MLDLALQQRGNGRFTFVWGADGDVLWDESATYAVLTTLLTPKGSYRGDDTGQQGTWLSRIERDRAATASQLAAAAQDAGDQVRAVRIVTELRAEARRLRPGAWELVLAWTSAARNREERGQGRTVRLGVPSPETAAALGVFGAELAAGFPRGVGRVLDWGHDPGRLLASWGQLFAICAAQADDLRLELWPGTSTALLPEWELAYGVRDTQVARGGAIDQRRDQVRSRAREFGAPTYEFLRGIVEPFFRYQDQAAIRVIEVPRAAVRALHTYVWTGTVAQNTLVLLDVRDAAKVSDAGAQVDVQFAADIDVAALVVQVTAPDNTSLSVGNLGRGTLAAGSSCRVYLAALAGVQVGGLWVVQFTAPAGATMTRVELFVEGMGREQDWRGVWRDGRAAVLAYWGVVAEEDLLGAGYNLEGARAALLRATYATRIGNLYRRSRGAGALPPGQIAMVCNDPGAICDQGIPG